MRIAISGSHGFIGSHLRGYFERAGHVAIPLVRNADGSGIRWSPDNPKGIDTKSLAGMDAIIHLAGENVFGLWSARKKKKIRDSRVKGTRNLCSAIAEMEGPPKIFLSASAIGFYGDRKDEILTEESGPGTGFLSGVCKDWEAATSVLAERGQDSCEHTFWNCLGQVRWSAS